ncbi:platelet-activating factor acetylhydrolase, isoform II-domain-containing protein [Achaetomium macrosporum]|uniref:1-alkyl-2-acetylglycerophosphocholine esterase n=1 Tax=Achaetomium macrosporum TaxID=79813 RepID=A0AAN7HG39_9PEZI|nr:platelet-activating factor acetylhydrolase, isoform II-domain-containing protein [Achaetomium macrosporum]
MPEHAVAPRRPPKSLYERIFHTLPPYTGPYAVGFLEIELPARHPRPFSPHIKRNGEYALKLDTVLLAIYYPADLDDNNNNDTENKNKNKNANRSGGAKPLHRVPWLPRPRVSTCKGYAKFFNVPHLPVTAYMALTSMFTALPAYRNARLSRRWPADCEKTVEEQQQQHRVCTSSADTLVEGQEEEEEEEEGPEPNERDAEQEDKPQFPVVIFSHGLGGSRTLYSSICGELASFGLVVVAMEHRDGSGARTFVNKSGMHGDLESQGLDHTSDAPENEKNAPKRRRRGETKPYYKIDYLVPKDNAQDTSPHNPNGVDKELREAQIEMRLAEIEEAFYVLDLINSGNGEEVYRKNLRKRSNIGSSSVGLDGIDWQDWVGRLDLGNVTMMGHSFGGATTVQALRSEKLTWITQGILLDPWGPATPECTEQRSVHKPVLSIGSEAFMHWQQNFDCVKQVCREARDAGTLAWMTTVRGSTHLSQTDFAVLYPNWMSFFMKTIVDPERAIYLTVHTALEFLKITLPASRTRFAKAWGDEQLLLNSPDCETRVVSEYRPHDKWLAARLKIPNEFSVRLRSMLRWRGPLGRSLKDLVYQDTEGEIWCHESPSRDSVERYMRRIGRLSVPSSPQRAIV